MDGEFRIGDEVAYRGAKAVVLQIIDAQKYNSVVLVKSPITGEVKTDYWYLPGTQKTGNYFGQVEMIINAIEYKEANFEG